MPANTNPIFPLVPDIAFADSGTAANAAVDGTGTVAVAFTAGANGSLIYRMTFLPLGTNSNATVARLFVNNGGSNATAANNSYFDQVGLSAVTQSVLSPVFGGVWNGNLILPANWRILVTLANGATVGYRITCFGGDY